MSREYLEKIPLQPYSSFESEYIVFEDFAGPFNWAFISGNNSLVYKAPGGAYSKIYGLIFDTLSSPAGDNIEIRKFYNLICPPVMQLEVQGFIFSGIEAGKVDFRLSGDLPAATGNFEAGIRIDATAGTLSIYNSAGGWTQVYTFTGYAITTLFDLVITFDLVKKKYKELRLGQKIVDLSAYAIYTGATAIGLIMPKFYATRDVGGRIAGGLNHLYICPLSS